MRKRIFLVLAIVWMMVIFAFSGRNATQSTEDSYAVGMAVGAVVVGNFYELPKEEQIEFAEQIDNPVRKTAHALEYAMLAMLLTGVFYGGDKTWYKCFVFPWLVATIYATSDECHQLFVPGRSGQVTDVLIDSFGAFVGVLLLSVILHFAEKHQKITG